MTYLAGTFPTTGTTRNAILGVLNTALTGAGWENLGDFDEPDFAQYANGATFYRVWRSSAANSGLPRDLYITMYAYDAYNNITTQGDQTMCLVLSHDFDQTTKIMKTGTPQNYYTKTDANGYPVVTPTRPRSWGYTAFTAATGTQYFISVTPKRLLLATRSSNNTVSPIHLGYVQNLFPTTIANADTPAWVGVLDAGANSYGTGSGGFLREPGAQVTADSVQALASYFRYADFANYDTYYYGGFVGVRPLLCHYRSNGMVPRGYVDGLVIFTDPRNLGPGTPNLGDSVTANGTKYVCFKPAQYASYPSWFVDTTI